MDGKLRLIDFDAFATIVEGGEDGEGYACAKFSSGVLPPEALYQLKGEDQSQFDAYWEDLKTKDTDLWSKVQPKVGTQGKQYVVKTFRAGDDGNPIFDGLPYELLPASASLDIWSLGVLLYQLLTGENLVPVTRDDDFVSGTGMGYVAKWNEEERSKKLSKISDPAANDLLSHLLSPDPTKRSKNSLRQLLDEHSFFNFKPDDTKMQGKMDEIKEGISKVREEQEKQNKMLLRIDLKIDQVLHQLSVQLKVLSTVLSGVAPKFLAPRLICFLPADAFGNTSDQKWLAKIKSFQPRNLFNETVRVFFFDPIRLTLAPTNGGEGFELTYPKEWVVKAMPYVKLGLITLKVAYIAGRLAGFPVPDVASVVGKWIDGQLHDLSGLAGQATEWLSEQTKDPALASSLLAQVDKNARKAIAGEIDEIKPLEGDALGEKMKAPLEKSFEELDTLLNDHGNWREKSGLVLTTSGADGTSEYVLETDKAAYEEHGASLFSSHPPPLPPAQTAEASATRKVEVDELERLKAEIEKLNDAAASQGTSCCCVLS